MKKRNKQVAIGIVSVLILFVINFVIPALNDKMTFYSINLPSELLPDGNSREILDGEREGCLTYGPYIPVKKGKIDIIVYYETDTDENSITAYSYSTQEQFVQQKLPAGKKKITIHTNIKFDVSDLEVVTFYNGEGYFKVDKITIISKESSLLYIIALYDILFICFLISLSKNIPLFFKTLILKEKKMVDKISKLFINIEQKIKIGILKRIFMYLSLIIIMIIGLCIIYGKADIRYPLIYQEGDDLGVSYVVKTIKNHGWSLVNPDVGGNSGANMYDYPFCSKLSFGIVWIISLFVDNIYIITNIFFFSCMILSALTCLNVCLNLRIKNEIAIVVSILYGFMPYMHTRYPHMWLVPCFMMPLCCMVAIWIIQDEFNFDNGQWWKNKRYWQAIFISFFSALTGLYYAFFTCVIYAIAIVIRVINKGEITITKRLLPVMFFVPTIIGIITDILPSIIYWLKNGTNANSELALRGIGEAELYGLKLIQMLLPRGDHRIKLLANIANKYNANYPLVNENSTALLGIIGSIGFILSLILLFSDKKKDKTLAYLNIGLFLVGTIGGIGAVFSLLVHSPMRCYNRISVLIMFISLLTLAAYIDEIKLKLSKGSYAVLLFAILIIGFLDQTVQYQPYDTSKIDSNQEFVAQIEEIEEPSSMIFQLPYIDWPSGGSYRMFTGYLASDTLRWSFGSMQGRSEALWQRELSYKAISDMIPILIENGYDGIYLDAVVFYLWRGEEVLNTTINDLTDYLQKEPLVSLNGELYYWSFSY